jgi:hypothetical protein
MASLQLAGRMLGDLQRPRQNIWLRIVGDALFAPTIAYNKKCVT